MKLEDLKKLAGLDKNQKIIEDGSNISYTGTEKAIYQKKHNIQPGTQEWFKLWFSLPYLTHEDPTPLKSKK
jgi:hypothetical protein